MKIKGATNKRIFYFMSMLLRVITFIGCLIAYIVVKIAVKPQIDWLNVFLLLLSLGSLLSGLYNLCLSGMTATSYKQNKAIQILGMIFTIITGGFFSSVFTCIAVAIKPTEEEIKMENLMKIKKKGN